MTWFKSYGPFSSHRFGSGGMYRYGADTTIMDRFGSGGMYHYGAGATIMDRCCRGDWSSIAGRRLLQVAKDVAWSKSYHPFSG